VARFLITVWPFPGHVNPGLAVAHALRARHHEVAFYTGRAARPVVEGEGFRCFPFVKLDEERIDALMRSEISHFASLWDQLRRARQLKSGLKEWLLGTVPGQIEDLRAILREYRPDVVVCETALWGPILVLQEIGPVPVAVLSTVAACLLPGSDVPAWGRGLPRPRNWRMRLRSRLERRAVRWLSADVLAEANRLRGQHGLPPLRVSVTEHAGRMPLYLVPSTPEFDYDRRDLPPSVHYVGPCLWDKGRDEPTPQWLAELPCDRPVVHVTEATIHMQEPILLRTASRALGNRPFYVVMTTGRHRDPAQLDLGPLAPNIRVERYVPHSDVLPRTAAVVTMGGAGTLLAALKSGVPLVVVPTEWDKPENAQRVVEAGAGLRLDPKRCTPERLRVAVERVLAEPSFRQNAQRLAAGFARYRGPARAAELLEGMAAPVRAPGAHPN
jgi:MGT family glycosyltransferase